MIQNAVEFLSGPYGLYALGGFYFGSVLLERVWAALKGARYNNADALCSIGLNLMNHSIHLVLGLLLPFVLYVLVWEHYRLFDGLPLLAALVTSVNEV